MKTQLPPQDSVGRTAVWYAPHTHTHTHTHTHQWKVHGYNLDFLLHATTWKKSEVLNDEGRWTVYVRNANQGMIQLPAFMLIKNTQKEELFLIRKVLILALEHYFESLFYQVLSCASHLIALNFSFLICGMGLWPIWSTFVGKIWHKLRPVSILYYHKNNIKTN
jgi:hypothetical protein